MGQDAVAKEAKMSQQSYSDLETGKSKGTTRIGSLARALGVDAYWLETGIGQPAPAGVRDNAAEYVSGEQRRLLSLIERLGEKKRRALLQLFED